MSAQGITRDPILCMRLERCSWVGPGIGSRKLAPAIQQLINKQEASLNENDPLSEQNELVSEQGATTSN